MTSQYPPTEPTGLNQRTRELLAGATQGRWAIWHDLDHHGFTTVGDADSYSEIVDTGEADECNPTAHVYVKSDAALIVHLHNNAEAYIAAVEAVERVRRIHWHDGGRSVSGCDADGYAYPCPTIRALDGGSE